MKWWVTALCIVAAVSMLAFLAGELLAAENEQVATPHLKPTSLYATYKAQTVDADWVVDPKCVPDGKLDDVNDRTACCSGVSLLSSTHCDNPAAYYNGWKSCTQVCGAALECPYGPTNTPWCPCPKGSWTSEYGIGACN